MAKKEETNATAPKVAIAKEPKKSKTASTDTSEIMEKYQQMMQFVQNVMSNVEMDIKRAKIAMNKLQKFDPTDSSTFALLQEDDDNISHAELQKYTEEDMEVVEGEFDGYFMIGADQKKYPVPMNYASKTKLVPGDILKLKITKDGKFIYKLIRPVERVHIKANLSKTDENKFIAMTDDGKTYFLNQAAVTFFKGKPGDELYIVTNAAGSGSFAAIEAIIKK